MGCEFLRLLDSKARLKQLNINNLLAFLTLPQVVGPSSFHRLGV
jgi:hypothetical protein